jgi:O-antigen/teichoic acid export membrane protein
LALAAYARIASMERAAAAELTTRVMRHTLLLLGLVCAVIFAAADVLVALFFEDEFEPMAPALRILLPGTLVFSMAAAFSAFYTYQRGKPWASAVVAGAALVMDVGLALVLVPAMGVDGAALATTISYVVPTIIALAIFARSERLSPARIFRFGRADVEDYRRLVSRARALLQRPHGEPPVVASEDGQ